jgi:hypothetical protein
MPATSAAPPEQVRAGSGGFPNIGVSGTSANGLPRLGEHPIGRSEELLHPRNQAIVNLPATALAGDQSALPQASQVCRYIRLAQLRCFYEVTHPLLSLGKPLENQEPAPIREAAEEGKTQVRRGHSTRISPHTYKSRPILSETDNCFFD